MEQGSGISHRQRRCLLIHGFTGGPYEVQPLADYLAGCGCECHVLRLPGHDDELSGLRSVVWQEWLQGAEEEMARLTGDGEPVDLIGFSMGGLISAYLANRYPVRRLVLLNAAAIYVSPVRFLKDVALRARQKDWDYLKRGKKTPLRAAVQFMKLARYAKREELPKVAVPTLIAQGRRDQIVHPRSADYIYRRLQGERELHFFERSRHLICLEEDAPALFAEVRRFLGVEGEDRDVT
ncbi:alpha/beta hydrolase [Paenibacillus mucilaginosus]|uniref:Carboxylesterase n=3 Tax=Paenibacillus mucilaginosus TaxID=61624 RepID=H6ND37_9BACL|nr:alpha/beta fold hydrolase [Paenibacillus mucilaginosus]AEI41460.1 carboxylesterase [Paenibacillus mucilaginosus KNP414]AFC29998.1 carboxylesterase [Paenibacillus mucilaginosus 3016]AFH62185.1 carboxylesterase [Paenibacillus mucilaginosus K02]MCG7215499.1 alpha/beta fold hydrolase [Paenibacillus mucilaginosus]WDM30473.1 alpha/beta fold hydrolase [Paenibacillus mucilaginosus]